MSLLDKVKQRITQQGFEFLKDMTEENDYTDKELRQIYKDAARVLYQVRNTYTLRQLLVDILAEDYSCIGILSDDIELFLK